MLNSKDIIHTLFTVLCTDPKDFKRGFIVGYSEMSRNYVIQFPSNRFSLRSEQVEELCKIIDDFFPYYLKAYRQEHFSKSQFIGTVKELHDLVQETRIFYNVYDSVTPSGDVIKAYDALNLTLIRSKLSDDVFHYVSSKLPFDGLTKENIFIMIQKRRNLITENFLHNHELDMIPLSLVVLLKECKSLLTHSELKK
ncbi:hypothetical protein AB4Z29_26245 [Paenibacillus sp. 2TAB23]|uniref:hypothetical protein n=1 Tax=Paenibacillus sp. 2TAB23 TaxID=3233004 RepID=UPI003F9760C0